MAADQDPSVDAREAGTQVGAAESWVTRDELVALGKSYQDGPSVPKAKVERDKKEFATAAWARINDLLAQNTTLAERMKPSERK